MKNKASKRLVFLQQLSQITGSSKNRKWKHFNDWPGRHSKAEYLADLKAAENKDKRRHKPKGQR